MAKGTAADRYWLERTSLLAIRGHGGAEPNPLVGCIVLDEQGCFAGSGAHRQCGGAHAEVLALQMAGERAAGGTLYVTLEPCSHHGRTPPCCEAVLASGIRRVVFSIQDPHALAGGGAEILRANGIEVEQIDCPACHDVLLPFLWRCRTGLPWITAKWAQSLDGRIATRSGHSQWISGSSSRSLVHRERGRVDAILTGIGTVQKDDPQLTARNVRVRRTAIRIVVDPRAELPPDSKIAQTASDIPVIVLCLPSADSTRIERLKQLGIDVHQGPTAGTQLDLRQCMVSLADERSLSQVLVEAGPGLLSSMLDQDLVRECAVFIAPLLVADAQAIPPVHGESPLLIKDGRQLQFRSCHRYEDDLLVRYGVPERPNSSP